MAALLLLAFAGAVLAAKVHEREPWIWGGGWREGWHWLPSFRPGVLILLSVPALGAAVVTGLLLSLERKRLLDGHCQGCGYDLTGNVSGVCPECGMPTTNPAKQGTGMTHRERENRR